MGSQNGLENFWLVELGGDLLLWRLVVGEREGVDAPEEDPH